MSFEVKVPAVGESITEATIAEWVKADGDYVERDEVLLVLETDKASVEVVAEQAGVLSHKAEEGDTVEIDALIAVIDTSAEKPAGSFSASDSSESKSSESASSNQQTTSSSTPQKNHEALSPAARKTAADLNINPSSVQGTGKDGRVTKGDLLQASKNQSSKPDSNASSEKAKPSSIPEMPKAQGAVAKEVTREKMSRLRQTIASRLVEAQQTAAILTTFNEIDMTAAMELRSKYKEAFKEKYGLSLGFMGLFTKAAAEALKQFPRVNASIDGDEIEYRNFVNMGIAVSTEKGLLVPVIQQADQMTVAEIEQAIRHYALKARDGKISIDDLNGGTFTISNGGVFGSLMSTPILNPPQSGILGLHKIEERPIALNGEVVIRPMMYVALSYDHRIIDGKESVSFLVRIKELMEDPARMLLHI